MRIRSKFYDYYDYIANLYNGGDPNILYLRKEIDKSLHAKDSITGEIAIRRNGIVSLPEPLYFGPKPCYSYAWLVIAGKYYMVLKHNSQHKDYVYGNDWHVLCPKLHDDVYNEIINKKEGWFEASYPYRELIGSFSDALVSVSKQVKAPVFLITNTSRRTGIVTVQSRIPVLSNLGVASLIDARLLYQDIAYFLSNVMVESADTKVPVIISDKDMLISKGFHKTISFRHRKI